MNKRNASDAAYAAVLLICIGVVLGAVHAAFSLKTDTAAYPRTIIIEHGPLEFVEPDAAASPYPCGCEQACARDCWTDGR